MFRTWQTPAGAGLAHAVKDAGGTLLGHSAALRQALIITAVILALASPAVVAQQARDKQEPRRRIPVRLLQPGETRTSLRRAEGHREIPVRMLRPGTTVPPMEAERQVASAGEMAPFTPMESAPRHVVPDTDTAVAAAEFGDLPIDGKRSTATWTDTPPTLDGRIDDDAWLLADVVSDFMQKEPVAGSAPTKRTEVRVLYDEDTLYFGWINYDEEPDNIGASVMRRDAYHVGDDWVAVYIDTFHDHRNALGFEVNPLGAKFDYTVRDESQLNTAWDETWEAAASITEPKWLSRSRRFGSPLEAWYGGSNTNAT